MPANGVGRIDPNALDKQIQSWQTPVQPKAAPKAAPPPQPAGPTGFWGRMVQVGIGKVNALNAYRAVVEHKPANVQSNSLKQNKSLVKQGGSDLKQIGKSAISGEQTTANVLARVLPGGQNDIKQENQNIDQQNRDRATIMTIKNPAVRSKLLKSQGEGNTQAIAETRKSIPSRGQAAAGVAATALDALSGGGGSLALKEGTKFTAEKGAQKLATGQLIKKVPEALQAGKKTQTAVIAATGAGAGVANAKASGASGKQAVVQGLAGAGIPLLGAGISKVFEMGPRAVLSKVKGAINKTPAPEAESGAMHDVMTPAQADKVAAAQHTKIPVADTGTKSGENVAVRTPVRPGVKQVSETSRINVRTPQRMTDQQFHQEFNKLSKGYEQEHAALQKDIAQNAPKAPKPTTPMAQLTKSAKPDLQPIDGYHHTSELIKDHGDMMRQIDQGVKGGQIQKTFGEKGNQEGYIRTSEHTPFYSQHFKDNGKAPTIQDYRANAKAELESGKAPYGMSDTYHQLKARETGATEMPNYNPKTDSKANAGVTDANLTTRQQVQARTIDAKYENLMNNLLDRYHNPDLSAARAPKTIARETLPAGRTRGGASRPARAAAVKNAQSVAAGNRTARRTLSSSGTSGGGNATARVTRPGALSGTHQVSGSALKSEARAVEAGVTKELANKATYSAGSYRQESENAVKLLNDNPEKARSIAFGHTPGNNTIHEVAVRRAVEARALREGDAETLRTLANSSQHTATSEAAQRLGAEGYGQAQLSPVDAMRSITQARQKASANTVDKAAAQASKEIEKKIKVPTKDEWHMFVESIKC